MMNPSPRHPSTPLRQQTQTPRAQKKTRSILVLSILLLLIATSLLVNYAFTKSITIPINIALQRMEIGMPEVFESGADVNATASSMAMEPFPTASSNKYKGKTVDIMSVASKTRPDYVQTQQATWAKHDLVRNFFVVDESIDEDDTCLSLDPQIVLDVPRWCRQTYLSDKSWIMNRYVNFYARERWLMKKANPLGWLCAQRRFPLGLARTLQKYTVETLPDYLLVVDDDTYYNMDTYYEQVVEQYDASIPTVAAGCRVTNGNSEDKGVVFPFGGFGVTFSRAALERMLMPLDSNEDKWAQHALQQVQVDLVGEQVSFRDGMNLAQLMEAFVLAEPFQEFANWTRGFCFHGHWVLSIFSKLYKVHASEHMDALMDSKIILKQNAAEPTYSNLCLNEYDKCKATDLVCHYQTPDDMRRLMKDLQDGSDNDEESESEEESREDTTSPMIIVKSRFMQFQPKLLALGKARLQLFETFCLPTLVAQTTQDFLWLIRIDPELAPEVLAPLKAMLAPYSDRFFLIASNDNTEGFRTLNVDKMSILLGEKEVLRTWIARSQDQWLVEMRLDADDGLHKKYIESVRTRTASLQQTLPRKSKWKSFCVSHSINWHSGALSPLAEVEPEVENTLNVPPEGILFDNKFIKKSCITPGLSYLLPPHVQSPPLIGHHVLHEEVPACNSDTSKDKCLERLQVDFVQSVQARTPTSHGMGGFHREYSKSKESERLWEILNSGFNITQARTTPIIADFKDNIVAIAKDNLQGQCTEDHTCSNFARRYLERIIWNKENKEQ